MTTTFLEQDTGLHLWFADPKDQAVAEARNLVIRHLRARGFRIGLCPETKRKYRSISQDHHRGRRSDLEVRVIRHGRHVEIQFFQNLVFSNPNGGEYDFDKRRKMPYLIGKQYEVERNRLGAALRAFADLKFQRKVTGQAFIDQQRAELCAFQGRDMYATPPHDYNAQSAHGKLVRDGDIVFFRDYDGRLRRGIAQHNINNMWWVLSAGQAHNIASFKLLYAEDITTFKGRAVPTAHAAKQIARLQAAAVKSEAFERAAQLRDAARRIKPALKAA